MDLAAEQIDQAYIGTQVLGIEHSNNPLIICFHGSGESCRSWLPLAHTLSQNYRVLLYDRQNGNAKPKQVVIEMGKYLEDHDLNSPYVLIAHSYGGCFAREFLQRYTERVAGMILAETGQETAIDAKLEQKQYRQHVLGRKPLSVIRCNSLIGKQMEYQRQVEVLSEEELNSPKWIERKRLLEAWDKEDEKLKKRQLELSLNSRYVYVPTCGHHVIRDRPDVVVEEVKWVMETWDTIETKTTFWESIVNLSRQLTWFRA